MKKKNRNLKPDYYNIANKVKVFFLKNVIIK